MISPAGYSMGPAETERLGRADLIDYVMLLLSVEVAARVVLHTPDAGGNFLASLDARENLKKAIEAVESFRAR